MLFVSDLALDTIAGLLRKYGLSINRIPDGHSINGSYWGEPEAGVVRDRVFVRGDTPIHFLLHETCHVICMTRERRTKLKGDASGDDLEERDAEDAKGWLRIQGLLRADRRPTFRLRES